MSMHYLGKGFDIHGGGADLTFPHHENEIAQSEAGSGAQFVKYWIHNGFVNIRSEKMSKSLGNVLNIREILERIHPEALRLFLLSSHYRSPLDYNENSIREASTGLERLYGAMAALHTLMEEEGTSDEAPDELVGIKEKFSSAMDDDFNTPRALAILFEAARAINRMSSAGGSSRADIPSQTILANVDREIKEVAANVLGLLTEDPVSFLDKERTAGVAELEMTRDEIEALIAERARARQEKDYKRADEIRSELDARGVLLEDSPQGTTWKVKNE
jgi:cysteinyl-tRNA synthetase